MCIANTYASVVFGALLFPSGPTRASALSEKLLNGRTRPSSPQRRVKLDERRGSGENCSEGQSSIASAGRDRDRVVRRCVEPFLGEHCTSRSPAEGPDYDGSCRWHSHIYLE